MNSRCSHGRPVKVPLTHVLADVLGIRKRKQLKDTQGLLAFYHMKFGDNALLTIAGINLVLKVFCQLLISAFHH